MGNENKSGAGYSRFSKSEFENENPLRRNKPELSRSLRNEIQLRLHPIVLAEMEKIVRELNEHGHNMRHRYPPVPGEIHFRDWNDKVVDLLVASDVVITVDFGSALEE